MHNFNEMLEKLQEKKKKLISNVSRKKQDVLKSVTNESRDMKSKIISEAQEKAKKIINDAIIEVKNYKENYIQKNEIQEINITTIPKEKLNKIIQFVINEVLEDF